MSGLHQAALMGHTAIMELLLENGASVTLKDSKGNQYTPFCSTQNFIDLK